jgi:hypothetical protein
VAVAPSSPAALLAQGGGHDHLLTVGVSIGPLVLRVVLLAAIPAVAAFALLRGFLPEPGRWTLAVVVGVAGGAAVLELLLSGGLNLPQATVPLLLALLAAPLYLVLSREPRFAPAVGRARRFAPWVFWPAGALAAVEFARAWFAGGPARTATFLHTSVVLALVALAWFAVSTVRRPVVLRGGAGVLALVLLGGGAQATLLRPAEPVPGVAVADQLDTRAGVVDVVVVPNLPGWNLVHVSAADASVGTSRDSLVAARPRPGTDGGWAVVELPAGRSSVWVGSGGETSSVATDTGTGAPAPAGLRGADGAECASAVLGRALATDRPVAKTDRCPADTLAQIDADVLRQVVERLAAQGHRWLALAADATQRGRTAELVVRTAAAQRGLAVRAPGLEDGPLLVVSGWTPARTVLLAHPDAEVHLAPWLRTSPPLVPGAAPAPSDKLAGYYRATLAERFPGASPSASGYRAWFQARGSSAPTGPVVAEAR